LKKLLAFFSFVSVAFICDAQPMGGLGTISNSAAIYVNTLTGKRVTDLEKNDIEGSPFLSTDFRSATIVTQNGFIARDVPVRFNIYNNEMIFKSKGKELALDSVKSIVYYDNDLDSTTIKLFASGYPKTGSNNTGTIYRLLAGGAKVHFLKYLYQKLEPKKTMGFFNLKEYVNYHDYYLYTAGSGLVKVRLNHTSVAKALPGMEATIEKIVSEKKLNLRKEQDVILLVGLLDNL
jgi:hypothetical protein